MPIYEYTCHQCDTVFEEWTKHVEEADVTHPCPNCHAQCKRLMSQTSFVLGGGGWYATEYGNRKGCTEKDTKEPVKAGEDKPAACPAAKSDSCAACPAAAASGSPAAPS